MGRNRNGAEVRSARAPDRLSAMGPNSSPVRCNIRGVSRLPVAACRTSGGPLTAVCLDFTNENENDIN